MIIITKLKRLIFGQIWTIYFMFFGLSCLLLCLWWFAFYPGCLSPDSWEQWRQSHNLSLLDDGHPVLYTLLIFVLTLIWDSPGVLILFNILLFSHIIGMFLVYLRKKGVRLNVLFLFVVLITLNPTNGRMIVAFWKDITYSLGLLYLFLVLAKLITDKDERYLKSFFILEFVISLSLVLISRHNGILVVLFSVPVFVFLIWRNRKFVLVVLSIPIFLICVNNTIKAIYVNDKSWYTIEHIMIKHLGSYLVNDKLTEQEKLIMLRIMPDSAWRKSYSPWTHDGLAFGPYGDNYRTLVPKIKIEIRELFFNKVKEKPMIFLKSQLSISQLIWRPIPEKGSYLNTYCDDCGDGINKSLRKIMDKYTGYCHTIYARYLFWMGPTYIWLNCLICIVLFFTSTKPTFLVIVPDFLNLVGIALVCPSQDFRYVYPSVMVFPFFLLFFISNHNIFTKYIIENLRISTNISVS